MTVKLRVTGYMWRTISVVNMQDANSVKIVMGRVLNVFTNIKEADLLSTVRTIIAITSRCLLQCLQKSKPRNFKV